MSQHDDDFAEEGDLLAEARIIQKYKERITNPISAIRSHCVECMGGQVHEIQRCTSPECSLFPFRMGKNTLHKKYGKPRTDLKPKDTPDLKRRRRRAIV
jgi:hypothetical protein